MYDLRYAGEIRTAAEYVSKHEGTAVEVLSADGSATVYIGGEERLTPLGAAPMPQVQPAEAIPYMDLTPVEVRLGQWHEELERFIPSRTMSPQEFIELYELAIKHAR